MRGSGVRIGASACLHRIRNVCSSHSGVDRVPYWTHKEALEVKELPRSLTILGGGVIGVEFASYFNSLGVKVTVVEMMDEILSGMDRELAALLRKVLQERVSFLLSRKVAAVKEADGEVVVEFEGTVFSRLLRKSCC